MTVIEADIECDAFIPPVDGSLFQPWYSSPPTVENNIRHCFVTYVRVMSSAVEPVDLHQRAKSNRSSDSKRFNVSSFSFLPKTVFEKHDEFLYLRLVQDIIATGNHKDDRAGNGTLSKFGCQVLGCLLCPAYWSHLSSD